MANSNQIELVVTVEVDKANQSIKSVNANLSGIESTAAKAARGASQGIDGMTASMVKGATAGNLLADAIKKALQWAKEWTIEAAKEAAHVARMESATRALAKAHGINAQAMRSALDAVQKVGFENEEALQTINRLIVADIQLSKAKGLAQVAKDAAALKDNLSAGDALEHIVQAIEFGNARALREVGLRLDFEKEIQIQELKLGRTLSDNEKIQIRYNAVMREAAKIQGAGAAASGEAESQMRALGREVKDLREAVGALLQDELKSVVAHFRDLVKWLRDNVDVLERVAKGLALVGAAFATYKIATWIIGIARAVKELTAALVAGRLAMVGNPMGLLITAAAVGGYAIYSNWRDTQDRLERDMQDMERRAVREKVFRGDMTVDQLRKQYGDEEATQIMTGRRLVPGAESEFGNFADWGGPKITVRNSNEPDLDALKLAAEMRKHQRDVEKLSREAALAAGAKSQTGFAREMAEMNAQIEKWTTFTDDKGIAHRIGLTRDAWVNVIDQLERRWGAFKRAFTKENREAMGEYINGEEEAARARMQRDAQQYQARLQYNEEIARQEIDHVRELMEFEAQRAGFERDARLRQLEGVDARTIEQKVAVERQKAEIEIEYLEKVHEVKQRLFDLDTSMMALEIEARMQAANYQADAIAARIAEFTQARDQIRQQMQETTDEAIKAARENSAVRQGQIVRDEQRRIFESLKQQAGGVFDALLHKSQSVWSAIGNSFKTAMLTAIKEVVTSNVARMLMQLFGGFRGGSGSPAYASAGGGWGALGGLFGIGGFGGGGGIPGIGPGGTPPFLPSGGGVWGTPGGAPAGGGWSWSGMGAGYKNWLTNLGNIGFRPERWRMDEAGNMTQLAGARGVGGWQGGAMLLGGGMLAMEGLRRGGWSGVGMTTAGGALIGAKFGGPIGAVIGGAIGFAAGIGRLFVKSAEEKARDKIKATYGVDIRDKGVLKQIVEMAKQGFGGNLDMAIRSQQVREIVELYALSTGQNTSRLPATVRPASLVESGGSLFQSTGYSNGTALPGLGGLPTFDAASRTTSSGGASAATPIVQADLVLDPETIEGVLAGRIKRVLLSNPRIVSEANVAGMRASVGRREGAATMLSPSLVTS